MSFLDKATTVGGEADIDAMLRENSALFTKILTVSLGEIHMQLHSTQYSVVLDAIMGLLLARTPLR